MANTKKKLSIGCLIAALCGFIGLVIFFLILININDDEDNNNSTTTTTTNTEQNTIKVLKIDDNYFNEHIINLSNNKIMCSTPSIIDYNATWCGPCKQLAPILDQVQKEYGNKIQIYSVDIDECQQASKVFHFEYIPTLVFINPNTGKTQMTGGMSKSELENCIAQYLGVSK